MFFAVNLRILGSLGIEHRYEIMKTMILEVDAALAMEYRDIYLKFDKSKKVLGLTPRKFVRAFVEDRLREEIDFVREQLNDAGI